MVFSDVLVNHLIDIPVNPARLETFKGLGLVVMTSAALYFVLWHYLNIINAHLSRFEAQRSEMQMLGQFRESVIDNAAIWINVLDKNARVTVWNQAAEQISGYCRQEVLGGLDVWELLYPDPGYRSEITAMVDGIIQEGAEVEDYQTRIRAKNGAIKTIAWNSRRFFDERDEVIGSIAIGRDITSSEETRQALIERERQLANLMAHLPGMAYRRMNDAAWTMKFASGGCRNLTGFPPADLIENAALPYAHIVHDADRTQVEKKIRLASEEGRLFAAEYRIIRKNGDMVWVWEQGQGVTVGEETFLEGIIIDISSRKKMELELERLAIHDPLTGLYNRRELERRLGEELARARRYGHCLGLLWIDLDHFKSVNDLFGHQAGDEVLRRISRMLHACIRSADYIGRYGGEELIVVLPEVDETEAEKMAHRLRHSLETTRISIPGGGKVTVTASIGVAAYPVHGLSMKILLRSADEAMYDAKKKGRNNVVCSSGVKNSIEGDKDDHTEIQS
jgi:diguanylate cyclase (GGDEF)-like protein/PAS domain S-box-containing protein